MQQHNWMINAEQFADALFGMIGNIITAFISRLAPFVVPLAPAFFFATLKSELVDRRHYRNQAEARRDIFAYIEGFYNRRCRHSTLAYASPIAFEKTHALCFNQVVH